jgi:hypothetical protein
MLLKLVLSRLVPLLLAQIPQLLAQFGLQAAIIDKALLQSSDFLSNPLFYVFIAACTTFIVGLVVRALGLNKNRGIQPETRYTNLI